MLMHALKSNICRYIRHKKGVEIEDHEGVKYNHQLFISKYIISIRNVEAKIRTFVSSGSPSLKSITKLSASVKGQIRTWESCSYMIAVGILMSRPQIFPKNSCVKSADTISGLHFISS